MIGRFLAGEEVSADTIASDLIAEVGPLPGHYMDKRHTIKWWRKEQYVPKAADRLSYSQWLSGERKVALDYARERMESLLSGEAQSLLTDSQEEDLRRILAEARAFFAKREG
jgi:trimethylamine--corrinoid protein Co-methyltransferase